MKKTVSTIVLRSWLAAAALVLVGTTMAWAQPDQEHLPPPEGGGGGGGGGSYPPPARYGMTWQKVDHDSNYGADHVDCYGCNAYTGDTLCSTALPILCSNLDGSPNPGISTNFYIGWVGGNIALTPPILGTSLGSLANANLICQIYHGTGWQMAEFHHPGGGWSWWSYGNVSDASRFWTYINDQPANCWN